MIKSEDYVSLEVAKMLKEKGFDEPCEKAFVEKVDGTEREEWNDDLCAMCTVTDVISYPRPTLYEAAKWLRNQGIHINVYYGHDGWLPDIFVFTKIYYVKAIGYYDTYEQALNAGILEALKLI